MRPSTQDTSSVRPLHYIYTPLALKAQCLTMSFHQIPTSLELLTIGGGVRVDLSWTSSITAGKHAGEWGCPSGDRVSTIQYEYVPRHRPLLLGHIDLLYSGCY